MSRTGKALYAYDGSEEDGAISLQAGDAIEVDEEDDTGSGWMKGTNLRTNQNGFFPVSYFEFDPLPAVTAAVSKTQINISVAKTGGKAKEVNPLLTQKSVIVRSKEKTGPAKKATVYGIYAKALAILNAKITAAMGVILLAWDGWGNYNWPSESNGPAPGFLKGAGVSNLILGLLILGFECDWHLKIMAKLGKGKEDDGSLHLIFPAFPKRAIVYAILATFQVFIFPTIIAGGFWIVVVVFCIKSYSTAEKTATISKRASDVAEYWNSMSTETRLLNLIGGQNPEGRVGRVFCLVTYFIGNMVIGAVWYSDAAAGIQENIDAALALGLEQEAADLLAMSGWIPWAKFFGGCMNLNFTLIFLPVAHSMIRSIFAVSTDQTAMAVCLRKVLYLVPLDQALKMHKLMGLVGGFCALSHTICHLFNFGLRAELVWATYGSGVWWTGSTLLIILFFLIPATQPQVKKGQFEIFWATHFMWPLFVAANLFHGKDWLGPNYWKFWLGPGGLFVLERIVREYKRRRPARIKSFTHMYNPEVISLAFMKEGPLANRFVSNTEMPLHREGQYAFINCPHVSSFEWHPMTISAAPHEKYITFHIRVQSVGSWTFQVKEYLSLMTRGAVFAEFTERNGDVDGRVLGIDGKPLFFVDGPYSAPTQHLKTYEEVMVCASGIGVTPLAATMKSVVHHIWPRAGGTVYPSGANFYWVCSYNDIPSFKWFLRTIREACDRVAQLEKTGVMNNSACVKHFGFHLYLTSYERMAKAGRLRQDDDQLPDPDDEKEDVAFWGKRRPKEDGKLQSVHASFTEDDIWRACTRPQEKVKVFGDGLLTIHNGRPNWEQAFEAVAKRTDKKCGVMFCGNPAIGSTLKKCCDQFTKKDGCGEFLLHKEVF